MPPRYAIYYSPDPGSALELFGKAWLGGGDGKGLATRLDPSHIARLTEGPRHYGFHGTLKPPFSLNPMSSLDGLLAAARVQARNLAPVEIPPLELAVIGKFIALTPSVESAALEKLAAVCVRAFEGYRMPMSEAQIAEYKQNKLTVHQEQMLEHWGYPYVMEEFRFHMSLTDRIENEAERNSVMAELTSLAAPILGKPVAVRAVSVFAQTDRDEAMTLVERIPFGRRG